MRKAPPSPRAGARIVAWLRRFRADAAGSVAIIVAILAPLLVGAMGLGGETGYWYMTQRRLQNAADVAAHGAGTQLVAGEDQAAMQTLAEYLAGESGVDLEKATVAVNRPPTTGGYVGDYSAVEVIVTRSLPRMFSAIYASGPVSIQARAVALSQAGGTGCVLALSQTAEGAITVSGSSESTLTLCDMISNSAGTAFIMSGNGSSVSANCVQTAGTAVTTGNLTMNCAHVREHAGIVADPFADVEEPELTGPCQPGTVGSNNTSTTVTAADVHSSGMPSKHYCNGLDLSGTVTFASGLYLIEGGDFTINSNATVFGDEVVFYLADGVNLKFNGTATVDLSAPTSGPYAGILIFGSRSATTAAHVINGNLGSVLDGAIYAPESHLTVSGSMETSEGSCTQFVTGTVNFSGSGTININCESPFGPTIESQGSVALVE